MSNIDFQRLLDSKSPSKLRTLILPRFQTLNLEAPTRYQAYLFPQPIRSLKLNQNHQFKLDCSFTSLNRALGRLNSLVLIPIQSFNLPRNTCT